MIDREILIQSNEIGKRKETTSVIPGIIFLDVDGVLNTSRCFISYTDEDVTEKGPLLSRKFLFDHEEEEYYATNVCCDIPFEKRCLHALKWLIDEANKELGEGMCKIVVSSSWREEDAWKNWLLRALEYVGIDTTNTVIGETPDLGDLGRGVEISTWITENKHMCQHFVILDDSHEQSFTECGLLSQWVQTYSDDDDVKGNKLQQQSEGEIDNDRTGLTMAAAVAALQILKRPEPKLVPKAKNKKKENPEPEPEPGCLTLS